MRLRSAIALSIVSAGLGASLVACFDLFHSTSGILDACQLDAGACADGGTDFCAWSSSTAYANAATACTWLDTCDGAFEDNDFGECMVRALLVYDCAASSNHVSGNQKAMWDALWQAKSCQDVARIVSPGAPPTCPPQEFGCNANTRFNCGDGGRPLLDSCTLWGQSCDKNLGCQGCLGCFDAADDAGDAGTCTPSDTATCDADIATSCPAGVPESVNCAELLHQPYTCKPGPISPSLGTTSPCYVDAGADAACVEACSANTLTACARGVPFTFDCAGTIDASCAGGEGGPASCVFQ
jgi:hypothetical protein